VDELVLKSYLDIAVEIAIEAGEVMKKHFNTQVSQREKSDKTIVTIADEEINNLVISRLNSKLPSHSVYGEEGSSHNSTSDIWVCDPIDGTVPYSKNIPVSVFSLAYCKDGVPLIGVVIDPFFNRIYTAIKGQGAYLNSKKIQVSDKTLSYKAIIDYEWWPEAKFDISEITSNISKSTKTYMLSLGSVIGACCLVARGDYEAVIFPGTTGKNVDIAAMKVIIEESGGRVTDLFGREQRYDQDIQGALLSNGKVHTELLSYLSVLDKK